MSITCFDSYFLLLFISIPGKAVFPIPIFGECMSRQAFRKFMKEHEENIIQELHAQLGMRPLSDYQDFFLRTEEGLRRLRIWVHLVINALGGRAEALFRDQEKIAYTRAVQGFSFGDITHVYLIMHRILNETMRHAGSEHLMDLHNEYSEMRENMFRGHSILAAMFLKTREEVISEKIYHLRSLHDFTREMIKSLGLPDIVGIILRKSRSLFRMERSFMALYQEDRMKGVFSFPASSVDNAISSLMEKSYREKKALFMEMSGKVRRDIALSKNMRIMAVQVLAHNSCYGVLALQANKQRKCLSSSQMDLLYQLLNVTAIAMENSHMFIELEERQKELSFLTEKLINVQEEERRQLAADIHDNLAQALTGMGYKIQVCKELLNRNPRLLAEQLDSLSRIAEDAARQSRGLMSSLRPDLLDDIGLVAALRKFMGNFSRDTNIKIETHLPKYIQLPPELKICLFRVVQEALSNVYKHSGSKTAEVRITKIKKNINLTVSDEGKGFTNASHRSGMMSGASKMGLLAMKERVEAAGGSLYIDSRPGFGCRLRVSIPIGREQRVA